MCRASFWNILPLGTIFMATLQTNFFRDCSSVLDKNDDSLTFLFLGMSLALNDLMSLFIFSVKNLKTTIIVKGINEKKNINWRLDFYLWKQNK